MGVDMNTKEELDDKKEECSKENEINENLTNKDPNEADATNEIEMEVKNDNNDNEKDENIDEKMENITTNENKENLDEKIEAEVIVPPNFIELCEKYLLDVTKGFSNIFEISDKYSHIKNNAEEDSELLNNYINQLKEDIKTNENELSDNNKKLEDVLKEQESKNENIKEISENISKVCLDKNLDEYKPLIEKLES